MLPKNWKDILIWLLLALAIGLGVKLGFWPDDVPLPPMPIPIFEPTEEQKNGGWKYDEAEVEAIQDVLPFRVFADTPAGRSDDPLPDKVYLWEAYKKVLARGPPSKDQSSIGSCVSFGTNNAVCRSLMVDIAFKGAAFDFKDISEEVTYGGSRVQVGKGRLGRGDGSVGAWAAEFVQKWGVVAREKHGKHDLSTYSVARCREFGVAGVPAELIPVAQKNPVKEITLVKTWADAKKSLASGYAIAICSGQGFSMQRDANGVCKPSGSWAHCMALDGYCTINGKEHGHIVNSWGANAHTGPVGPGDPPPCGFWADATVIHRMLSSQPDSWAFSSVVGFPKREIDWFVRVRPVELNRFALRKEVTYALSP